MVFDLFFYCVTVKTIYITAHVYDVGPEGLIRNVHVCKYRKSFLIGLITCTSLTHLLQANHRGQLGTSKSKSTDSPALNTLISQFLSFALISWLCSLNFFLSSLRPAHRLALATNYNSSLVTFMYFRRLSNKDVLIILYNQEG